MHSRKSSPNTPRPGVPRLASRPKSARNSGLLSLIDEKISPISDRLSDNNKEDEYDDPICLDDLVCSIREVARQCQAHQRWEDGSLLNDMERVQSGREEPPDDYELFDDSWGEDLFQKSSKPNIDCGTNRAINEEVDCFVKIRVRLAAGCSSDLLPDQNNSHNNNNNNSSALGHSCHDRLDKERLFKAGAKSNKALSATKTAERGNASGENRHAINYAKGQRTVRQPEEFGSKECPRREAKKIVPQTRERIENYHAHGTHNLYPSFHLDKSRRPRATDDPVRMDIPSMGLRESHVAPFSKAKGRAPFEKAWSQLSLNYIQSSHSKATFVSLAGDSAFDTLASQSSLDTTSLHSWRSGVSSLGMESIDDLESSDPATYRLLLNESSPSFCQRVDTTLHGATMLCTNGDMSPKRPLRRRSQSPPQSRRLESHNFLLSFPLVSLEAEQYR